MVSAGSSEGEEEDVDVAAAAAVVVGEVELTPCECIAEVIRSISSNSRRDPRGIRTGTDDDDEGGTSFGEEEEEGTAVGAE